MEKILIATIIITFLLTIYNWTKLFLFDLFTFSIFDSDFNLFVLFSTITFVWTMFYNAILSNNIYFYGYILFTILVFAYLFILFKSNKKGEKIKKIEEEVRYAALLDVIWNLLVIAMIIITISYNPTVWGYSTIAAITFILFTYYFIRNYVNYLISNKIITEKEILDFWLYDYYEGIYKKDWEKWLLKKISKMFIIGLTYKVKKDERKESKKFIPMFPILVIWVLFMLIWNFIVFFL